MKNKSNKAKNDKNKGSNEKQDFDALDKNIKSHKDLDDRLHEYEDSENKHKKMHEYPHVEKDKDSDYQVDEQRVKSIKDKKKK